MSFMILAITGIILWVTIIVMVAQKKRNTPPASNDPLEILKQRLAKGEISSYEYEDLKRTLDS